MDLWRYEDGAMVLETRTYCLHVFPQKYREGIRHRWIVFSREREAHPASGVAASQERAMAEALKAMRQDQEQERTAA